MAIIRDRELIEKDIPVELIASCIMEHQEGIVRLNLLDNYYLGKHAILERPSDEDKGLPNNRLVAHIFVVRELNRKGVPEYICIECKRLI